MKKYYLGDIEITKREILVSIVIVCILLVCGLLISNNIRLKIEDKNQFYENAIKIDSDDLFSYGMRTNVGYAFVSGTLSANTPISFEDQENGIPGEYLLAERKKQHYTMHTTTYTTTDSQGHTTTHTLHYWTWDTVKYEEFVPDTYTFRNVEFVSNKFSLRFSVPYIETIKIDKDDRYEYYGIPNNTDGILFTKLENNTILDDSSFLNTTDFEKAEKEFIQGSKAALVFFWIGWTILMVGAVIGFYAIDNRWLE